MEATIRNFHPPVLLSTDRSRQRSTNLGSTTTFHAQWAVAGKDVNPGSYGWYLAFLGPYETVSSPPVTAMSRIVADMLMKLREDRKGSPVRQASPPRKQRTRREGEVTISEFAKVFGLGPRQFRTVLLKAGMLQTEIVVQEKDGDFTEYLHTARLPHGAVKRGFGRRLEPRSGTPYDVLTPKGQEWVSNQLKGVVGKKTSNARHVKRDAVWCLLDQGKTQAEIVRLTGMTRQLVSYHSGKLAA